jgi:hypothetical protein
MSIQKLLKTITDLKGWIEWKQRELTIRLIMEKEGLTEKECDLLVAVLFAENYWLNPSLICKNTDGSYDYGTIQANSKWYIEKMKLLTKEEALNDVPKCIAVLIKRYQEGFLSDWYGYRNKGYKKYL